MRMPRRRSHGPWRGLRWRRGCRGYRKVDLPFITLAQFWKADEHPDPEEEVLQGVISYLQARWEEFTERDVGIFIDLADGRSSSPSPDGTPAPGPGETDPVFWLVTSRARTKMAEAQHDAYMDYIARQKAEQAAREAGGAPPPAAQQVAKGQAEAAKGGAQPEAPPSAGPGPLGGGWSSARSNSSASSHSKLSSQGGCEDVL